MSVKKVFLTVFYEMKGPITTYHLEKGAIINGTLPDIGIMVRVFANGPGDLASIPGGVIPKTTLLKTQHYKVRIKGSGAIQGKDWRPPLGVAPIEKGAFFSPSSTVANFTYL